MKQLQQIPRSQRTFEVKRNYLSKNGCDIRVLFPDELDSELVEIAVKENGFAYRYVPLTLQTKQLLSYAIASSRGMIISEYMSDEPLDSDLQLELVQYGSSFFFAICNPTEEAFDKAFYLEPSNIMLHYIQKRGNCEKHLKHKHITDYFKSSQLFENSWVSRLHDLTDDVSAKLLADLYIINPVNERHMRNHAAYADAMLIVKTIERNKKIDSLINV